MMRYLRLLFGPGLAFLLALHCSTLGAQQLLREMVIEDISGDRSIQALIVRDPGQSLLVIRSEIASLSFKSNNLIYETRQVGSGEWNLYVQPGTHVISFQAEGFRRTEQRIFLQAKTVKALFLKAKDGESVPRGFGTVVVSSTHQASIYVDGAYEGKGRVTKSLPAGEYGIIARKEGFLSDSLRVFINVGETEYVFLDPQPIPKVDRDAGLPLAGIEAGGRSKWLLIGGGALVAAGAAAFILSRGGSEPSGNGDTGGDVLPEPPPFD